MEWKRIQQKIIHIWILFVQDTSMFKQCSFEMGSFLCIFMYMYAEFLCIFISNIQFYIWWWRSSLLLLIILLETPKQRQSIEVCKRIDEWHKYLYLYTYKIYVCGKTKQKFHFASLHASVCVPVIDSLRAVMNRNSQTLQRQKRHVITSLRMCFMPTIHISGIEAFACILLAHGWEIEENNRWWQWCPSMFRHLHQNANPNRLATLNIVSIEHIHSFIYTSTQWTNRHMYFYIDIILIYA